MSWIKCRGCQSDPCVCSYDLLSGVRRRRQPTRRQPITSPTFAPLAENTWATE